MEVGGAALSTSHCVPVLESTAVSDATLLQHEARQSRSGQFDQSTYSWRECASAFLEGGGSRRAPFKCQRPISIPGEGEGARSLTFELCMPLLSSIFSDGHPRPRELYFDADDFLLRRKH